MVEQMNSPVLFLIFNRPDATARVFDEIRRAKPPRLYVAADGPRLDRVGEPERCAKARAIVSDVDWVCEVHTLFRDENIGCKRAVSGAIDWFFGCESEGVILEDDCLPSLSFFGFCDELLEKYRFDSRVGQISGFNSLDDCRMHDDYLFSKYGPIWGWASWRRAWDHYDVEMKLWPTIKDEKQYKNFTRNPEEEEFRIRLFDMLYRKEVDTWDYQWVFAKLINSMLTVIPAKNLIENIGFDDDATHTKSIPGYARGVERKELAISRHPRWVLNDINYESMYFDRLIRRRSILRRALRKLF
jgi:hypothetical protein